MTFAKYWTYMSAKFDEIEINQHFAHKFGTRVPARTNTICDMFAGNTMIAAITHKAHKSHICACIQHNHHKNHRMASHQSLSSPSSSRRRRSAPMSIQHVVRRESKVEEVVYWRLWLTKRRVLILMHGRVS